VFGAVIVLLGLAASALFASAWRSTVLDKNRKAFQSTATDVRTALDSNLEANLAQTRTLSAIATMEPKAGASRLERWYQQLQRRGAAPVGVSSALIQIVPASGLAGFRRALEADTASRKLLRGGFQIVPPGPRDRYCLSRATVGSAAAAKLYPPLLDYCAPVIPGFGRSPFAVLVTTATATGSTIVTPIPGTALVAVGEAVYRRGAPLDSAAARRRAVTALVGTSFVGADLARPALAGRRTLAVSLYHRNTGGGLQLVGRAGSLPRSGTAAYSERKALGQGWIVEVSGTAAGASSADTQGIGIMAIGTLVTLLLFMLYRVLSRSRVRAWSLVGEKTGELEYRSLHDALTDLPNRHLVLDRGEQMLARSRRAGDPVSALFMDIDGFKQINDRYGHRVGDEVLRQVASRLKAVLRESDTVGRLGGDEFVMLVDPVGLDVAPELIAERILEVVRQPIAIRERPSLCVTASIGIATGLPDNGETLMNEADLALYEAKATGKDRYAVFASAMQAVAQERIHLEIDLAHALDAEEFFLVYQPMLDLATEKIVGVEALIRWRHPRAGEMAPDSFIPLAEDNGMIVPIGRWVLEEACAQAATWAGLGYELNLSVNVSPRQLERTEFVEEVKAVLLASGLEPAALTLEITETALMRKPEDIAALLNALKELGVRIAVDDFGTGYSSLAYLRQFPVDSLKIDRTFITNLARSSEAHALAHTLIQLGKALGLETLAEGVEHHSQLLELQREGCDLAQGFLFARPLDVDGFERYLRGSRVAGDRHAGEVSSTVTGR
jgi:diguanylate cyclase (GGDEF)-like protein